MSLRPAGTLNSPETRPLVVAAERRRVIQAENERETRNLLTRYPQPGAEQRAQIIEQLGSSDPLGNFTPGNPSPDAQRLAAEERAKAPPRTAGAPDAKKKTQVKTTPKANTTPAPTFAPTSLFTPTTAPEGACLPPQVFPNIIESAPYNMAIYFAPYNPDLALQNKDMMKAQTEMSVVFPLPANLTTTTGLDYTNMNLGVFGGELIGAAAKLATAPNFREELNNQVQAGINLATGDNASSRDLRSVLLRRLLQGVSSTAGAAVDLINGSTPNPHVAVTFNNVKLRTFSFTWKFSPTSADESKKLHKIIKLMQRRILPDKSSNFLLRYPNQVQIEIKPQPLNQLFQFKPAVITDMNINYAPNGVPSFFKDDMPTDVELSLTFQEIQIRTSADYDERARRGQE